MTIAGVVIVWALAALLVLAIVRGGARPPTPARARRGSPVVLYASRPHNENEVRRGD